MPSSLYSPFSQFAPIISEGTQQEDPTVQGGLGTAQFPSIDQSLTPPAEEFPDLKINRAKDFDEEFVQEWMQRIESNIRYRKHHWNGLDCWVRFKRLYAGLHWGYKVDSFDSNKITVNTAFAVIRNFIPSLYMKDPKIFVEPTQDGIEGNAAILESVVNKEWRIRKCKYQTRLTLLDAAIFGWGVAKAGYRFNDEVAKNAIKDGEINYSILEKADCPFVKRISVFNFLWDFIRADHLDESRWATEIYFRNYDDVIADSRFVNTEFITAGALYDLKEDIMGGVRDRTFIVPGVPDDEGFVALYDIYDKKYDQLITLSEACHLPHRVIDNPFPSMERDSPFELLRLDDVPDEPFPPSMIALIEDQIYEQDRIRTTQFSHRRRFVRKYWYVEKMIDRPALNALKYGEDGALIKLKQPGMVGPIDDAPQSQDQLISEQSAKQDIIEITGSSSEIRVPSKKTATQTRRESFIDDIRTVDKQVMVGDFMSSLVRKFAAIIQDFYDTPRAIKISGEGLGKFWVRYTSEQIQGQFLFNVNVQDMFPNDPNVRRKQIMDLYNLTKGDPLLNRAEMLRRIFAAFEQQNIDALFNQPMPQVSGQNQALQQAIQASGGAISPDQLNAIMGQMATQQPAEPAADGTAIQEPPPEAVSIEGAPANLGSTPTGGS